MLSLDNPILAWEIQDFFFSCVKEAFFKTFPWRIPSLKNFLGEIAISSLKCGNLLIFLPLEFLREINSWQITTLHCVLKTLFVYILISCFFVYLTSKLTRKPSSSQVARYGILGAFSKSKDKCTAKPDMSTGNCRWFSSSGLMKATTFPAFMSTMGAEMPKGGISPEKRLKVNHEHLRDFGNDSNDLASLDHNRISCWISKEHCSTVWKIEEFLPFRYLCDSKH